MDEKASDVGSDKREAAGPSAVPPGPAPQGQYRPPPQQYGQTNYNYHYYPQPGSYYCGGWYYSPTYSAVKPPHKKSSKPTVAGVMLIITGILAMVVGAAFGVLFTGTGPMWDMMENGPMNDDSYGNIQGTIIHMNSTPVEGVTITVVDLSLQAMTNSTGHYKIMNIPSGWHELKVELPGYKTILKSVSVKEYSMHMHGDNYTAGDNVVEDFQLQPGSGEYRIGTEQEPGTSNTGMPDQARSILQAMSAVCLTLGLVGGIVMTGAGYMSIKRRNLPFVIVGCVFAILTSTIFGIIALILVLLSTNEFDQHKKKGGKGHKDQGHGGQQGGGGYGPAGYTSKPPQMDAPTTREPPTRTQYMAGTIPPYQPPYYGQQQYPRYY